MRTFLQVSRKGLVALPMFVTGVCINELILAGNSADWLIISVVALSMACALISTIRSCTNDRRFYYWGIQTVTVIATVISILFVILVMSENVIPSDGTVLNRNRPEIQNGTDCNEIEPGDDLPSACYDRWVHDVKSSWSILIGNILVLLNTTLCSRRVFHAVTTQE